MRFQQRASLKVLDFHIATKTDLGYTTDHTKDKVVQVRGA
jgi:hypothetical protein